MWGELVFYAIFPTVFGHTCIWRLVSTAGGTQCCLEWTSSLPLAIDNCLSWDSNPSHSGEGLVVSKRDASTTRPRRPLHLNKGSCQSTWDWLLGMKMTHLYPSARHIWASPIPVFPAVPSTTVPPGSSKPETTHNEVRILDCRIYRTTFD